MALVPLATKGNYFHVYDFRVKPGRGDEFNELFNKFDYGDNNRSTARAPGQGRCVMSRCRRPRPFLPDR
jgi:hypothetical protein